MIYWIYTIIISQFIYKTTKLTTYISFVSRDGYVDVLTPVCKLFIAKLAICSWRRCIKSSRERTAPFAKNMHSCDCTKVLYAYCILHHWIMIFHGKVMNWLFTLWFYKLLYHIIRYTICIVVLMWWWRWGLHDVTPAFDVNHTFGKPKLDLQVSKTVIASFLSIYKFNIW